MNHLELIVRLQSILDSPTLTLTIDGGGITEGPCKIHHTTVVLVHRDDVRNVIRLLNQLAAPADIPITVVP